MNQFQQYFDSNRKAWNTLTGIHKASSFYDLESFKRGKSTLHAPEIEEIGDVKEKSLLHLQCHFGLDTMSWARMGSKVTGVDLSDESISLARELNAALSLDATFICSNVYDLKDHLEGLFDIVYTSYGTIGWLPDLDKWAEIILHYLKPGGIFYIVDFHPVLWMMDENFRFIKYSYFNTEVIEQVNTGSYADRNAPVEIMEYGWNHSLSEIFNALIKQGLKIRHFNEFSFSPMPCFENLEIGKDGNWRIKNMMERLPMLYSIKAIKEL